MLEANDIEVIRSLVKGEHPCRKGRYVRRICIVVVSCACLYGAGYILKEEVLTRGWEFLVPALVDKFIFGIEA